MRELLRPRSPRGRRCHGASHLPSWLVLMLDHVPTRASTWDHVPTRAPIWDHVPPLAPMWDHVPPRDTFIFALWAGYHVGTYISNKHTWDSMTHNTWFTYPHKLSIKCFHEHPRATTSHGVTHAIPTIAVCFHVLASYTLCSHAPTQCCHVPLVKHVLPRRYVLPHASTSDC